MKTLKIIILAIFSIGLLTAVLPQEETKLAVETSNQDVKKPLVKLTAMTDLKKEKSVPTEG